MENIYKEYVNPETFESKTVEVDTNMYWFAEEINAAVGDDLPILTNEDGSKLFVGKLCPFNRVSKYRITIEKIEE